MSLCITDPRPIQEMKTVTSERIEIYKDYRFSVSVADISTALESVDSQEIISIELARPLNMRIYPKIERGQTTITTY